MRLSRVRRVLSVVLLTLILFTISVSASVQSTYLPDVWSDHDNYLVPSPVSVELSWFEDVETNPDTDVYSSEPIQVACTLNPIYNIYGSTLDYTQGTVSGSDGFLEYFLSINTNFTDYRVDIDTDSGQPSGTARCYWRVRQTSQQTRYLNSNLLRVAYGDFYCWSDDDLYPCNAEVEFGFDSRIFDFSFVSFRLVYSAAGSNDQHVVELDAATAPNMFTQGQFNIDPSIWGVDEPGQYFYIHSVEIFVEALGVDYGYPDSAFIDFAGYLQHVYDPYLRGIDINEAEPFDPDGNPAVPLLNYTEWIGTAVSGFLDLQIFPKFTIGGLLMTIVAFSAAIWFLKLFAGG